MRLVAHALAGPALKGEEIGDVSPTGELSALTKLTANWKSVVEDVALPLFESTSLSHQGLIFPVKYSYMI